MKRALVLSVCLFGLMSAVAFAGPSLNPWFEVNVPAIKGGDMPEPTLDAGLTIEGMLSPSWCIDLGATYSDDNLLDTLNSIGLDFESNIGFDQIATVNQTGSLAYGCEFTFGCDVTYAVTYPYKYTLSLLTPGFKALGYVGPLKVWAGVNLPWKWRKGDPTDIWLIEPFFGMRVDFGIDL